VFLRRQGSGWIEAVYGRSYWLLDDGQDGQVMVKVNWRNAFLLEPLALQTGEVAWLPIASVKRLWEVTPNSSSAVPRSPAAMATSSSYE
jgi:hypothetical protein